MPKHQRYWKELAKWELPVNAVVRAVFGVESQPLGVGKEHVLKAWFDWQWDVKQSSFLLQNGTTQWLHTHVVRACLHVRHCCTTFEQPLFVDPTILVLCGFSCLVGVMKEDGIIILSSCVTQLGGYRNHGSSPEPRSLLRARRDPFLLVVFVG